MLWFDAQFPARLKLMSPRWFFCLFALLAGPSIASDHLWRLAVAPHYRVLSQLSDRDTTAWMRGFDQFILSTSDTLKFDPGLLTPLTVVIFDRDRDFGPYKLLRPNGKTANVAGQFVWRTTWSMIGMAHEGDGAALRATLQHEATHWLMSVDQSRQPAWFSEGIAELFSTFERQGDKVNWAKPIGSHLALLQNANLEPLAQFLVEPGALFDRDDRTDLFYAQAWGFTHFLLLSQNPSHRPQLAKFLNTYKTESGDATVAAVFGPQLKDIEREFHEYINQRKFYYMIEPLRPAPEPPAPQPAPAETVEASLALLALGAERNELARQHAERAIARNANSPEGHQVLAYLALANQNIAEATRHAETAIAAGTKDSELYVLLGDSYATGANSQAPNAAAARANQYERAINLNPRQLAYYERLTEAMFAIEKPREEDAKFLQIGLQRFPGADWLRVGTAVIDFRLGHNDSAMATLEAVLRPDSTLEPAQRAYANDVRINLFVEAMKSDVEVAMDKSDFPAARAAITRCRERVGDDSHALSYLQQITSSVDIGELLAKYNVARQANRKSEARSVAEKLLALPDLPDGMRAYLRKQLGAVNSP
jgi:hypothetical protein